VLWPEHAHERRASVRVKMSASVDISPVRASARVDISFPVDVTLDGEKRAFGTLLNISRDGLALKSTALLTLGKLYKFHIRGLGTWRGEVVRVFNGQNVGVRFDNSEAEKRRIDKILAARLNDNT